MFPSFCEWLTAAEAASTQPSTTAALSNETAPVATELLPVLVIGAGPAGLAVMAELAARSVPFVCMEQSVGVGGMWDRSNNAASPVYPSLSSNVSRFSMTLSKPFDMPGSWPLYVPHQLVLSYLRVFADRHRLQPHIRFHHRVQQCLYDDAEHCWHVRFTHAADGGEDAADFSDVIVASGQNNRNSAAYPVQLQAQAQRAGLLVRHTSDYVDGEEFRDKRVLVLGLGISGAGIASLVSAVAQRTFVAVRTPQYLIPQWLFGKPTDQATHGDLPDLSSIPRWLSSALLWLGKHVLKGLEYLLAFKTTALGMRRPLHSVLDKGAVVTDDGFESAVRAKRIALRPEVIGFEPGRALYTSQPSTAVVVSADSDDIDAVIFATGYVWTFPFLPPALHPTTRTPSVIDTGRRPTACYNAPTTRASSLTMNLFSPDSRHLYFMTEVVHVYSAWPIFASQARAVVSALQARRRASKRAAAFDRASAGGFANPSFSGPFYKAEFWKVSPCSLYSARGQRSVPRSLPLPARCCCTAVKDGDEFYVDRSLYVNFLNQFSSWIEEEAAKGRKGRAPSSD